MRYDQEPNKRTRIVVPTAKRAAATRAPRTRTRTPRAGMKSAVLDAAIIVVTTLFTTLMLLFISGQLHDTTGSSLSPRNAIPVVSFAATPTPPKHASPTPQVTPSPTTPSPTPLGGIEVPTDSSLQIEIKKRISVDPNLAALGVSVTVTNSKVTLTGSVPSDDLKDRIEKLARAVKGIKDVDNQIVVVG